MWYTLVREYYPAIKWNRVLLNYATPNYATPR